MSPASVQRIGCRAERRSIRVLGSLAALVISVVACSAQTGTVAIPPSASARPTATPTVGATASIRVEALRQLLSDTGRTALRVCVYVDPAASANAAQATTLFDTTLTQLKASFTPAIAVDAVSACQAAPVFLATNSRHVQNSSSALPAGAPVRVAKTEVSPQALVVAVTTNAKIDAIFGGLATRRGSEQMLCDGGNCAEVTTSVYIADSAVSDPDARRTALLEGLGFAGRT